MKKTAIICIISLLLALFLPFSVYARTDTGTNAELLTALGICQDKVTLQQTVTRGEFAEYIANIYYGGKTAVTREKAVELVMDMGYMDMASSGEFEPDIPIRNDVAAKAAVELLGYGFKVKTASDYWTVAAQMKLVNGMKHTAFLSGEELVKLLTSLMEADACVMLSAGNGQTQYKLVKAYEAFFDVTKVEGQVTAAEGRSLSDSKAAGTGMARIDGKLYETKYPLEDFLGLNVEAYVRMTDDLIIYAADDSTDKIYITDDILNRDKSTIRQIVADKENGGTKSYNLAADVEVIINNDGYFAYTLSDLLIDYGSITLVDNDGDSRYDVVRVESYQMLAVNYIENTNMSIGDFYGNDINDLAELDGVTVTRNGKAAYFSEIMQDDIVGVAIDKGGNYAKIIATSETASGVAEAVDEDEITLDGVVYKLAPAYQKVPDEKKIAISTGDTLTVALDMYGRIAYVKRSMTGSLRYGYMTKAFASEVDDSFEVKIYTDSGEFVTYPVSYKAKLNSTEEFSLDNMRSVFCSSGNTVVPQLVKYRINADNEITAIFSQGSTKLTRDFDFAQRAEISGSRVLSDGGDFMYNSSTVIFSVPDPDPAVDSDEEDYAIVRRALNSSTEYEYTEIAAYDVDEFGYAKAIVSRTSADLGATINDNILRDTEIFVVKKVMHTVNSDNEPIIKLIGLDKESEKEYVIRQNKFSLVDGTGSKPKIERGDALIILTDFVTDYVVDVHVVCDASSSNYSITKKKISSGVPYYEVMRGKVHNRLGATLKTSAVKSPVNNSDYQLYPATGACVFVVEDGEVRYGSMGDVRIGDDVLVRSRAGVIWEVIIYR